MKDYDFWQVDAFSRVPYKGNAAAVIFDADDLSTDDMQTIARQFNLSESVFLCEPGGDDADYTARIFTPRSELPFAGHPTIAASYAWLTRDPTRAAEAPPGVRQRCGIGVVPIDVAWSGGEPRMRIRSAVADRRDAGLDRDDAARLLGCEVDAIDPCPAEVCSIGIPWLVVSVAGLDAIRSLTPDQARVERACGERGAVGLSAYARGGTRAGVDVHVRSFAPGSGIAEDPVCGSGNGAVALHWATHHAPPGDRHHYVAEQGHAIGRAGIIDIDVERDASSLRVGLGGAAVRVMTGQLQI